MEIRKIALDLKIQELETTGCNLSTFSSKILKDFVCLMRKIAPVAKEGSCYSNNEISQ